MTLVDRDREVAHLSRLMAAARGGTGAGIAISGEPGVGKSAVTEAACAGTSELRVLRGGCDPLSTPRPAPCGGTDGGTIDRHRESAQEGDVDVHYLECSCLFRRVGRTVSAPAGG